MAVACCCGRAIVDLQAGCPACPNGEENGNTMNSHGESRKASYSEPPNTTYQLLARYPSDTFEHLCHQKQIFATLPSRPQTTPPRPLVSPASSERSTFSRQSSEQLRTLPSNLRKASLPDAYSPMAAGFARLGKRKDLVDGSSPQELHERIDSSKRTLSARMMFEGAPY